MKSLIDHHAAMVFLQTGFGPTDWIAVLVKDAAARMARQRIVPIHLALDHRLQSWLDREQGRGGDVYVSVNGLRAATASRRRHDVAHIRHLFLDADQRADDVLTAMDARGDLPPVSYVLHTSPARAHIFWRVRGFSVTALESLQRWLARELHTDTAATSACQLTRWPGSLNYKRRLAHRITVTYRDATHEWTPADFPTPTSDRRPRASTSCRSGHIDRVTRARRYLAAVPPAITGHQGDRHTFAVCCRLVRGFALADDDARDVLREWNRRCVPPWSDRKLSLKLRNARRYGHERVGGLLDEHARRAPESTPCR